MNSMRKAAGLLPLLTFLLLAYAVFLGPRRSFAKRRGAAAASGGACPAGCIADPAAAAAPADPYAGMTPAQRRKAMIAAMRASR